MKPAFLYAYTLVVLLAAWYIHACRGEPKIELVASRALPENHLLMPGDLSVTAAGDEYLARAVDAGKPVGAENLLSVPDTKSGKGKVPVSLATDRSSIEGGAVDAGKALLVCPPEIAAEVLAVFCGDGAAPCVTVVDIAAGDLDRLADLAPADLSLKQACE